MFTASAVRAVASLKNCEAYFVITHLFPETGLGVVPQAQLTMTVGHCCTQLGVWGHCKPPQWVQGRALVGVQGAKPPEAQTLLHFRAVNKGQKFTPFSIFLYQQDTVTRHYFVLFS